MNLLKLLVSVFTVFHSDSFLHFSPTKPCFFKSCFTRSSICIQLLLFHNNQNNVYPHFFLVTLEFLELSCRDNIKRNQGEIWTFPPKTPTLYQWTTNYW